MVVRRRRKYRKKLGSRSYHGDTKNRRGSGIKGGVGKAGAWDHKMFKYLDRGKKGFRPPKREEVASINVGDVEALLPKLEKEGFVKREGKKVVVDLAAAGYTRLIGRGSVSTSLVIHVPYASEKARAKIEAAGGQVIASGSEGA